MNWPKPCGHGRPARACALLGALWIPWVGLLEGCRHGRPGGSSSSEPSRADEPSAVGAPAEDMPAVAAWRPVEPFHLLGEAFAYVGGDAWMLAGVEEDGTFPGDGEEPTRAAFARIVHERLGSLPLPSIDTNRPIRFPAPVFLGSDGPWGLLWAEAVPPPGHNVGEWPSSGLNQLRFAVWEGQGWSVPRVILQSAMLIDWERGRTVQTSGSRGPLLLTISKDRPGPGGATLQFGSVPDDVRPVTLDASLRPQSASFDLDESGRAVIAALVERRHGPARLREVVILKELVAGGEWSDPTTIATIQSSSWDELRIHNDAEGRLHVLWSYGTDRIYHLTSGSGDAWESVTIAPPEGVLLRWITGIDRAGRLVIVRHVLKSHTSAELQLGRWNGSWHFSPLTPQVHAFHLFEGTGAKGEWYVGWSGFTASQTDARSTTWLIRP